MENDKNFKALNPKMKASRKPSKQTCNFLRPSRIMKDGRMVTTKCCTAYIPGFEVETERIICEFCTVPDMTVRSDRCRFFVPMDIREGAPTRWRCEKLGLKGLDIEQCRAERCGDYEKIQDGKWEIGMLGKYREKSAEPKAASPVLDSRKSKLIPKSSSGFIPKKQPPKEDFSGSGYF